MEYIPIIQKTDFPAYVKIGKNVKDEELNLCIRDMQELDFLTWCDTPLYNDVMGFDPNSTNREGLRVLINGFIKPYLVCGSYYNFLLWCGRDITQVGLRVELSESSQDISDKARGELMADALRKKNVYLFRLEEKLCSDKYTYDGTAYTFYDESNKSRPQPTTGIKRIGGPSNRCYDKKSNRWL